MATGWYLAELVMEIVVEGDPRNVVHQNLTLVRADSADEAYNKALRLGRDGETSYNNPAGKHVEISFKGVSDLDEIYDELEDGAELTFRSRVDVSKGELESLVLPRERLRAFLPAKRAEGPDYASGEVISEVERRFGIKRPANGNTSEPKN